MEIFILVKKIFIHISTKERRVKVSKNSRRETFVICYWQPKELNLVLKGLFDEINSMIVVFDLYLDGKLD
jgi:hypothetical protein